MDTDSSLDYGVPFCEFIDYSQLPQTIKVTQGVYDPSNNDLDFSNGDALSLHKKVCPAAVLTFNCPETYEEKSVSVAAWHAARFKLGKFDPGRPALSESDPIIFSTVRELIRACPLLVRANKTYILATEPKTSFSAGDSLRPLRLLKKYGIKVLECRLVRSSALVCLPMDCEGDFEVIDDPFYYTINELIYTLPRQRQMRLARDIINEQCMIPGIPSGFRGMIMMEKPQFFVQASPTESPGQELIIPQDTDIMVSPRDDTYMGQLEHEYALNAFVVENEAQFPLKARVTTWEEQTALLARYSICPGSALIMHQLNSVPKYIIHFDDQYFFVPPEYKGQFRRAPRIFNMVGDLERLGRIVIKVVKGGQVSHPELHGTMEGTQLQLISGDVKIMKLGNKADPEAEVLEMRQVDGDAHTSRVMNVPLYLDGTYEEVLEGKLHGSLAFWATARNSFPTSKSCYS